MKCICKQKCFTKNPANGRAALFQPGQVVEFKKCPANFAELDSNEEPIWADANEDELMASKFSFDVISLQCKNLYGVDLKKTDKADIVKQFLDARNRYVPENTDPNAAK